MLTTVGGNLPLVGVRSPKNVGCLCALSDLIPTYDFSW